MGHVHLKVAAIAETIAFYRDVLGFGLMAPLGAQAAFLAAGGYHHHIGANTWESARRRPAAAGAARRCVTRRSCLPDEAERDRVLARVRGGGHEVGEDRGGPVVTDPSGNRLLLWFVLSGRRRAPPGLGSPSGDYGDQRHQSAISPPGPRMPGPAQAVLWGLRYPQFTKAGARALRIDVHGQAGHDAGDRADEGS